MKPKQGWNFMGEGEVYAVGSGVNRKYGFTSSTPFSNIVWASAVGIAGLTTTFSPFFQLAGVATLWCAVSCRESITRSNC